MSWAVYLKGGRSTTFHMLSCPTCWFVRINFRLQDNQNNWHASFVVLPSPVPSILSLFISINKPILVAFSKVKGMKLQLKMIINDVKMSRRRARSKLIWIVVCSLGILPRVNEMCPFHSLLFTLAAAQVSQELFNAWQPLSDGISNILAHSKPSFTWRGNPFFFAFLRYLWIEARYFSFYCISNNLSHIGVCCIFHLRLFCLLFI